MQLRLILQPPWLRFAVWAPWFAVLWGGLTSLQSRAEIESTILSAIFFGAAFAGFLTATTQGVHRGGLAALAALSQPERTRAIDAVSHGTVPADPEVRASAIRLGRAFLRNKTADQLKRAEIWIWVTFGILFALSVAAAVTNFANERLFYVVLAVLSALVLPLTSRNSRRLQRNVALLTETRITQACR